MKQASKKIFITGATGNVGSVLTKNLSDIENVNVFLGTRDQDKVNQDNKNSLHTFLYFDFETKIYPDQSFDAIFLVRPPHI